MKVEIEDEGDRQILLLAIAELALRRPGWNSTLGRLAEIMNGREMFESFKETSAINDGLQAAAERVAKKHNITLRHQPPAEGGGERWRHKKRGTIYRVIGVASSQVVGEPIGEGSLAVVYRSEEDGSLWVRPHNEFYDGRFERIEGPQPGVSENTPEPSEAQIEAAYDAFHAAFDGNSGRVAMRAALIAAAGVRE